MVAIGLLLLVVAAVVAVVGVVANLGSAAALAGFTFFGWQVTGTTGLLFLYGLIVGAVGMLGLSLMLGALARRRGAHRELRGSRREAKDLRRRQARLEKDLEHERTTSGSRTGSEVGASEARPPEQRTPSDQPSGIRERLGLGHRPRK